MLLLVCAACAAPVARYKVESDLASEKIRVSGMGTLFPREAQDFFLTIIRGNAELENGEPQVADRYFTLALGKARILEKLYREELRRREEVARLEAEKKRQEQAERELQDLRVRKQAEELARETERARRLEAERAELHKKVEKNRPEPQLVSRYTVKRGETLPQIAALPEVYAEASLWPLIYKANRDQISNPAVLWPGQVLRIPRNSDKGDISEARRFAAERYLR